ncbi:hypothetical protein H4W33_006497 [Kibdelosporangium phytohabitans]|nr:hypothetical protein [Kibdelosporangium phytohabitans]
MCGGHVQRARNPKAWRGQTEHKGAGASVRCGSVLPEPARPVRAGSRHPTPVERVRSRAAFTAAVPRSLSGPSIEDSRPSSGLVLAARTAFLAGGPSSPLEPRTATHSDRVLHAAPGAWALSRTGTGDAQRPSAQPDPVAVRGPRQPLASGLR